MSQCVHSSGVIAQVDQEDPVDALCLMQPVDQSLPLSGWGFTEHQNGRGWKELLEII